MVPLVAHGATVVDSPAELAACDIVFTMVGGPADFVEVTLGESGVLAQSAKPKMLIDSTSVDEDSSAKVRAAAQKMGVPMLAAPVSGNAKVVKAGKLTFAVNKILLAQKCLKKSNRNAIAKPNCKKSRAHE